MIRLNDWHHVAEFILQDVYELQSHDCLYWQYQGKPVRLHIPTMFIIGDIEGHDKLCGRKSGHGNLMKGVTHSCTITRDKCDDPSASCRFLHANEITNLQEKLLEPDENEDELHECTKKLKDFGFYSNVSNAFAKMKFGANPFGLHGAVAICLLHTFLQKFPNLVVNEYLKLFGVSEDTSGSLQVNSSLPRFIQVCKRQSDRDFPKLNSFSFSLTKGKHSYFAKEKYARVFALYIFTLTTFGWNYLLNNRKKSKYDEPDAIRIVSCLEKTLTMYQFMFQEQFDKSKLSDAQREVSKYMREIKNILDFGRDEKDIDKATCKFPKFHYLKHVFPMIMEFGSARNFDGGPNESHHKYIAKAPGNRTQGRDDTFDEQTCYNISAQIMLDQLSQQMNVMTSNRSGVIPSELKRNSIEDVDHLSNGSNKNVFDIHKNSSSFIAQCNYNEKQIKIDWSKGQKTPIACFQPDVHSFLLEEVFTSSLGVTDHSVKGFTDLNWNGSIIRAHPSYRSGQPWNDYVNIFWECEPGGRIQNYTCPAKILMFLDLRRNTFRGMNNQLGRSNLYSRTPGIYAIVHSTQTHPSKYTPTLAASRLHSSRGKSKIARFWTMESQYHLILVSSISSTAFVIPDYDDENMLNKTEFVIEVLPKKEWSKVHL